MAEGRKKILAEDLRAIRKAAENLEIAIAMAKGHGLFTVVPSHDLGGYTHAQAIARATAQKAHSNLDDLEEVSA